MCTERYAQSLLCVARTFRDGKLGFVLVGHIDSQFLSAVTISDGQEHAPVLVDNFYVTTRTSFA